MDQIVKDDKRKILMRICKNIVNARGNAIEIMRNTPLCNLRVINRASKNTKDPNPLSSTMAQINTKYPITIDREKAQLLGFPKDLLGPNDTHKWGRLLCKKEAVDWYIENIPAPTKDNQLIINSLFETSRKEVKEYYSIPWAQSTVKFGPVSLERKPVATQSPAIRVSRELRSKLLLQTLIPEYVIPYEKLDPSLTRSMREIASAKLSAKISLTQQIRILSNSLDPKIRTLPSIPGSAEIINPMRHAICQSNFLVNVRLPIRESTTDYTANLINISLSCIHAISVGKIQEHQVIGILHLTKVMGRDLHEVLRSNEINRDVAEIKFLMTLMRLPIGMGSLFMNTIFSPCPARVRTILRRNRVGTRYSSYSGRETVHFKRDALRGQLVHDADLIINITTNFTCIEELNALLGCIAAYCRLEGESTMARTKKAMLEELYIKFKTSPYKVIGVDRRTYFQTDFERPQQLGKLIISAESEYEEAPRFLCRYRFLENSILLKNESTQQSIEIPLKTNEWPHNTDLVDYPPGCLDDYCSPRKLLRRKMAYYHNNFPLLWSHFEAGNRKWGNGAFLSLTDRSLYDKIGSGVYMVFQQTKAKNSNPHLMKPLFCLAYCFARVMSTRLSVELGTSLINWCTNIPLDFTAQRGVLKIDNDGNYTLFGEILGKGDPVDYSTVLHGFLPGFVIKNEFDPTLPVKRMSTLNEKADSIEDGEAYTIYVGGKPYTCEKQLSITLSTTQTIERQLRNSSWTPDQIDYSFTEQWLPLRAAKRGAEFTFTDEASCSKMPKL